MDLQDSCLYDRELRFGELMVKRANRELERLRKQIEEEDSTTEISTLLTQYEQLNSEIMSFEGELRTYQSQVTGGNWSVS